MSATGTLDGPVGPVEQAVPADDELVARAVGAGLDQATGRFLADTTSTVAVIDAHHYVITHAFPNGAEGTVSMRLFQAPGGSPGAPPEVAHSRTDDEYRFTVRYAVATDSLPEDLAAQVTAGLPTAQPAGASPTAALVSPLGLAPAATVVTTGAGAGNAGLSPTSGRAGAQRSQDRPATIGVVADGVISQAKEAYVDTWATRLEGAGWTKTAKSWEAFKAGGKVWDAVEANDLIASGLAQVDALKQCARKPTNPLTRSQYEQDPQEQQKVIDALAEIEDDIAGSAMVLFTQLLTDTGSSLVSGAPWLGFLTSPATNYVKETLQASIQERLREAQQRVVPCRSGSYTIKGRLPSVPSGITLTGKACSLTEPFTLRADGDIVGPVKFRPNRETGGTWAFKGKVGNADLTVLGSGAYRITLAADASTGTLDFDFELTIKIPTVGDQTNSSPVSLPLTPTAACSK